MSVNYVALGKRIGYFRMQCGNITQESLASKINRSREFLAKIEKGTEHPSVATLVDIADALCISVDDLLIFFLQCDVPPLLLHHIYNVHSRGEKKLSPSCAPGRSHNRSGRL